MRKEPKYNKSISWNLLLTFTGLLLFVTSFQKINAQEKTNPSKVLVVVAHPDDETSMAATIYKITHEQGGIVDEAVITNGEAGFKYSLLAEDYYKIKLTNEKIGRENLPNIRKKELQSAGKIIGIRNFYFFDQKDAHYGLDEREPIDTTWNVALVKSKLKEIMMTNKYDFVFCILPEAETHAHHKAATILALETIAELETKPIILAVTTSKKTDTEQPKYTQLGNRTTTKISAGFPAFKVDRTTSFGFNNKLNYKIIVNWEIAEHKSQGMMQSYIDNGDYENFWFFDANQPQSLPKAKQFFDALNSKIPQ